MRTATALVSWTTSYLAGDELQGPASAALGNRLNAPTESTATTSPRRTRTKRPRARKVAAAQQGAWPRVALTCRLAATRSTGQPHSRRAVRASGSAYVQISRSARPSLCPRSVDSVRLGAAGACCRLLRCSEHDLW